MFAYFLFNTLKIFRNANCNNKGAIIIQMYVILESFTRRYICTVFSLHCVLLLDLLLYPTSLIGSLCIGITFEARCQAKLCGRFCIWIASLLGLKCQSWIFAKTLVPLKLMECPIPITCWTGDDWGHVVVSSFRLLSWLILNFILAKVLVTSKLIKCPITIIFWIRDDAIYYFSPSTYLSVFT